MTWLKNNLWAVILGEFCVIQIALVFLKKTGVIQWNTALVMSPLLVLLALAFFLVGCVIFLDIDEGDDTGG